MLSLHIDHFITMLNKVSLALLLSTVKLRLCLVGYLSVLASTYILWLTTRSCTSSPMLVFFSFHGNVTHYKGYSCWRPGITEHLQLNSYATKDNYIPCTLQREQYIQCDEWACFKITSLFCDVLTNHKNAHKPLNIICLFCVRHKYVCGFETCLVKE